MVLDVFVWEILKICGVLLGGAVLLKVASRVFDFLKKYTRKTATFWDDIMFETSKRIVQFLVTAGVFYYLIRKIDHETITTVLEILLVFLAAYLSVKVTDFIFHLLRKNLIKESKTRLDDLIFPILAKISKIFIYSIAFLISLDHLGYDVTALIAGMGIAGIAVSLAAKDSMANAIAGIFLILDKPFLPGDRIELWNAPPGQGTWGDVEEIGLRSTKVRTTDNITIIIPNSKLMTRDIINYTEGSPVIRIRIPVGVAYESDLAAVAKVLIETVKEVNGVLDDPQPQVVVKEFGDSWINVELRVWIKDAKERRRIQDEINRRIKIEFEKSSIEMPCPQREVHIKGIEPPFDNET
ncbi:MAG: mechanosensitive ion channel family protein [Theionarchaea archaeon]|nr:mechanosensitive ion channel family protein [Theionarchaea archaeon]